MEKGKHPIHFAPLQGYTEDIYRRLHNECFGGIDTYYTPFVRLEHGEVRGKDMRDVRPDFNEGVNVVPQVIANGGEEMRRLLVRLLPMGYTRIDVNMGCPFPLQTRHGRGAGLLPSAERMAEIAEVMHANSGVYFSAKMRLGMERADEWRGAMDIINDMPLTHLTVHPRVATQQYRGEVDRAAFEELLGTCQHTLIYNGDITSVDDIRHLETTYGDRIGGVMIGRGLLARPSLAAEYLSGEMLSEHELKERIREMHSRLLAHYERIIPGEAQQLMKARAFWDYLEPTLGRKPWKKIVKAGNMRNYLAAVDEALR